MTTTTVITRANTFEFNGRGRNNEKKDDLATQKQFLYMC